MPTVGLLVSTSFLIFVVISYSRPVVVCITGKTSFLSSKRITIPIRTRLTSTLSFSITCNCKGAMPDFWASSSSFSCEANSNLIFPLEIAAYSSRISWRYLRLFAYSPGRSSEKYTFIVNRSSISATTDLLDEESEKILLSVRSILKNLFVEIIFMTKSIANSTAPGINTERFTSNL